MKNISKSIIILLLVATGNAYPDVRPLRVDINDISSYWGILGLGGAFTGTQKITWKINNTGNVDIQDEALMLETYSWVKANQTWAARESDFIQNIAIPSNDATTSTQKFSRLAPEKVRAVISHMENKDAVIDNRDVKYITRGFTVDEINTGVYVKSMTVGGHIDFKIRAIEATSNDPLVNLSILNQLPEFGYENSNGIYDPCAYFVDESMCTSQNNELSYLSPYLFAPDEWLTWDKSLLAMDGSGEDFSNLGFNPTSAGSYLIRVHGIASDSGTVSPDDLLTTIGGNRFMDTFIIVNVVPEPSIWLLFFAGFAGLFFVGNFRRLLKCQQRPMAIEA